MAHRQAPPGSATRNCLLPPDRRIETTHLVWVACDRAVLLGDQAAYRLLRLTQIDVYTCRISMVIITANRWIDGG